MSSSRQDRNDYERAFNHYAGVLSDYADCLEKEITQLRATYVSPIPFDGIAELIERSCPKETQRRSSIGGIED